MAVRSPSTRTPKKRCDRRTPAKLRRADRLLKAIALVLLTEESPRRRDPLSTSDLAKLLGVSRSTLHGRLRAARVLMNALSAGDEVENGSVRAAPAREL